MEINLQAESAIKNDPYFMQRVYDGIMNVQGAVIGDSYVPPAHFKEGGGSISVSPSYNADVPMLIDRRDSGEGVETSFHLFP